MSDERICVGSAVAYWAKREPDTVALEDPKQSFTYAELDKRATEIAQALLGAGLKKGDRICWLGKNSTAYFTMLVAASRAGLVLAPVGWRLAAPEVTYMLNDTQAPLFIYDPEFADTAQKAAEGVPTLRHLLADGEVAGLESLSDWLSGQDAAELPETDPQDGVLQLYTSGTTGNPKGAVLSNANLFAVRPLMDNEDFEWVRADPGDKILAVMPIGHISGTGIGVIGFYAGSHVMVLPEFTPDGVMDCIDRGLQSFFLVPTALQILVGHPRAATTDFSNIKSVSYGAAPIPLELLRQCLKTMPNAMYCQQYGMTETTGSICILPPEDHDPEGNERMRGIGIPLPGVEMKIVDEQHNELPRGEIGEIATRSSLNMLHYFNNPGKTAETVDDDGWLYTGDAAIMDNDGYIYIKDRVKDMIISGGENVYPAEVENAVFSHPDVREVAVIGVPDEKWGEAVKAVVSPAPGVNEVDTDGIIAHAREQIAAFKAPKSVDVIPELPRNATGKILRRELRAPYWEGMEREVN